MLSVTAACRGPCTPSPPCQTPDTPLANAESVEEVGGRVRWYGAIDNAGSTLSEPPSAPFVPGGAEGTERAARISGTFASSAHAFAVLGLQLDPGAMATIGLGSVGFSFWTKSEVARGKMRVTATCSDGDSFALEVRELREWTEVGIPYKSLKPSPANHSSTLDATRIERVEWRLTGAAESYDLVVDEVSAFSCVPRVPPFSCDAK